MCLSQLSLKTLLQQWIATNEGSESNITTDKERDKVIKMTASQKFNLELKSINPMNIQLIELAPDEDLNPSAHIQTEDNQEFFFPIVDGVQLHKINEFIRGMGLAIEITFHSYGQYGSTLHHVQHLLQINKVLKKYGFNVTGRAVHEVMLDGFKGMNLVTKAYDEDNYEKYVLMAMDRFGRKLTKGVEYGV